jgi:hypothetical protein
MEGPMEGSSFLKPAPRKQSLAETIAMRRPAPLAAETDRDREPSLLRAARRWRDEWRGKRYARLKV